MTEPSKGAMRAARCIKQNQPGRLDHTDVEWLATIIDRETKVGLMLEALKAASEIGVILEHAMNSFHNSQQWCDERYEWWGDTGPTIMEKFEEKFEIIYAAIHAAENGES